MSRSKAAGPLTAQVLEELDKLIDAAQKAEEEEERLKALGGAGADKLKKRARGKSRDLQDQIEGLTAKALEKVFNSFDTDGNETIDPTELQAAYAASGIPISDKNLQKAMKLLDKNGDGVLDLKEFKAIAIMGHKR